MANFTHGCDLIKSVNGDYAFHIEFTLLFVLFPLYKTGESLLDVISGKTVKEGLKEEKQRNCHFDDFHNQTCENITHGQSPVGLNPPKPSTFLNHNISKLNFLNCMLEKNESCHVPDTNTHAGVGCPLSSECAACALLTFNLFHSSSHPSGTSAVLKTPTV